MAPTLGYASLHEYSQLSRLSYAKTQNKNSDQNGTDDVLENLSYRWGGGRPEIPTALVRKFAEFLDGEIQGEALIFK